ncbi:MAG: EamA family transporter [Alphaproteobacteria bacterium]
MSRQVSTGIGFLAVLMWAVLALFTTASGQVPPFQLAAMTFFIGGILGVATWPFRPGAKSALKQSPLAWLVGIGGLFGYHAVYFSALRSAPAIEASLIAYLWPLFLVVASALLPGEKLKLHHIFGVVLGLIGAFLVITKGEHLSLSEGLKPGHFLALICAVIWAGYSVLSRRLGDVPTDAVAGFCLVTSLLATFCHLSFEDTVWPASALEWAAIIGLGLFPVGAAFYVWDHGVKKGDIMVLGAASYASPLLSTLVLVVAGYAPAHWSVGVACLLITAGAIIAAKDLLFRRESKKT